MKSSTGAEAWRVGGHLNIDTASCAIGSPEATEATPLDVADRDLLQRDRALTYGSPAMVIIDTREDLTLPVEVLATAIGVVGLRVHLTTDVDELQGSWTEVASLTLDNGRAVVADPWCPSTPEYRVEIDLEPGEYAVSVFNETDDGELLAIRALRV